MPFLAFVAGMKTWPWRLIGIIVLAGVVLAGLFSCAHYFYKSGRDDSDAEWQNRLQQAENATSEAEKDLMRDVAARDEASDNRRRDRESALNTARTDIANAEDTAARLAAYRALRQRLRDESAAHRDRAVRDYMSSIVA